MLEVSTFFAHRRYAAAALGTRSPAPVLARCVAAGAAAWLCASPAIAADPKEPSAEDARAAELRFHEGKALLDQGLVTEACEKLAQSLALARKGGTLLNLAACRQRQGRHATALALFQEALATAKAEGRADRVEIAERGVLETRAKLAWVVITLAPGAAPAGLQVALDGKPVEAAALGSMIAVDPGPHTITAEAPGRKRWSATIESGGAGDRRSVEIPLQEAAPKEAGAKEGAKGPADKAPDKAPPTGTEKGTGMLVVGGGLLGAGAVAAIFGAAMGGVAIADNAESQRLCPGDVCTTDEGKRKNESAHAAATAANVLIPVGLGVAAAGGVVLLVRYWQSSRPSPAPVSITTAPWLTPWGGGIAVQGAF